MSDSVSRMTTTLDASGVQHGARVITKSMLDIISSTHKAQTALLALDSQVSRFGGGRNLSAINALRGGMNQLTTSTAGFRHMLGTIEERIVRIGATLAVFAVAAGSIGLMVGALKEAYKYMSLMETASLGIASSYLVVGEYYDKMTNKQLNAQKAFIASQGSSREAIEMLKVANLKTIATLDELVKGFQIALPVALRKGFDTKQVVEFTTAVYQMAGAIGQPFDQMSEEIRSLLGQANITKHSRMAQVLGLQAGTAIRKEFDKVENDGQKLFSFMMNLVKPFEMAGKASQKTWEGLLSNIADIGKIGLSSIFGKMFDESKKTLMEIQSIFGEINNETLAFDMDPKFLEGAKAAGVIFKDIFLQLKGAASSWSNKTFLGPLLAELELVGKGMLNLTASMISNAAAIGTIITGWVAFRLTLKLTRVASEVMSAAMKSSTISITQENAALARLGLTQQARISQTQVLINAERARVAAAVSAATLAAEEAAITVRTTVVTKAHTLAIVENNARNVTSAAIAKEAAVVKAQALYSEAAASRTASAASKGRLVDAEAELMASKRAILGLSGATAQASAIQGGATAAAKRYAIAQAEAAVSVAKATAVQARHTASLAGTRAAEANLLAATRTLTAAKSDAIMTDERAIIAAERYNATLMKQGITEGMVGAEQLRRAQVTWQLANADQRLIILTEAQTAANIAQAASLKAVSIQARITATAVSFLGKAGSAFKAMGGWLTLVTAALMAGIWAWNKYGDAAEKAKKKAGITAEEANEATQRIREQIKEIKAKQEFMDELERKKKEGLTGKVAVDAVDDKTSLAYFLGSNIHLYEKLGEQIDSNRVKYAAYQKVLKDAQNTYNSSDIQTAQVKYDLREAQANVDTMNAILVRDEKARVALKQAATELKKLMGDVGYKTDTSVVVDEKVARQRKRDLEAYFALQDQLVSESLAGHKQQMKEELSIEKEKYDNGLTAVKEYYEKVKAIRLEELSARQEIAEGKLTSAKAVVADAKAATGDDKSQKYSEAQTALSKARQKIAELEAEGKAIVADSSADATKDLQKQDKLYDKINERLQKVVGSELEKTTALQESAAVKLQHQKIDTEMQAAWEEGNLKRIMAAQQARAQLTDLEAYKLEIATAEDEREKGLIDGFDENPYAQEMNAIKTLHDYKIKMLKAEKKLREEHGGDVASIQKEMDQENYKSARESYELTLKEAAKYTTMASTLFGALADAQDTQSKEGFQAAKHYNMAATIMATATAIMNQLAIPGPVGWAGAALAAITGAIQLATIASTSFEGGGSINSPASGDFSGAGTGGGAGMVLGDSSAATMSIDNNNALLEEINADQYDELKNITSAIKALRSSIDGLVSNLVRSFGNFSGEGQGITGLGSATSTMRQEVDKALEFGGDGFNAMSTIAVGLTAGPLAGLITNLVGGWTNDAIEWAVGSIFGGGSRTWLSGSGLSFDPVSARDSMSGQDSGAESYYTTVTKKSGNLFHGSSTSSAIHYQELEAAAADLLNDVFLNMSETLVMLTEGLGGDVQKALNYVFDIGDINLTGLTGDQITEKLTSAFSYAMDSAVEALFGDMLLIYQQIGETASEALVRILVTKQIIESAFDLTNMNVAGDMIEITQAIADFAGGLSEFIDAYQTYYDAFFTDAEKQLDRREALSASLSDLGYDILPATRQGFRNLIEALDLTNALDQERYVTLLKLAPLADEYYSGLEDGAESYKKAIMTALDIQIAATQAIMDLQSGSLSVLSPEDKYFDSKALWEDTSARALAGDQTAAANLPEISKEFLAISRTYFGSGSAYVQDFDAVMDTLKVIAGFDPADDPTLTLLQQQLDALGDLRDVLETENLATINGFAITASLTTETNRLLAEFISSLTPAVPEPTVPVSVASVSPWYTPSWADGTDYVPYDMTADIHEGEMVIDRASSEALRRYGINVKGGEKGGDKGVEEKLDKVVAELVEVKNSLASINTKARLVSNA